MDTNSQIRGLKENRKMMHTWTQIPWSTTRRIKIAFPLLLVRFMQKGKGRVRTHNETTKKC